MCANPIRFTRARLWLLTALVCLATGLWCTPRLQAIDTTWVFDGDGNWADAAKWSNGEPIDSTFNTSIDDGEAAVTVTLNDSRAIGSLAIGLDDTLRVDNLGPFEMGLTVASAVTNGSILLTGGTAYTSATRLAVMDGALTNSPTGLVHFESSNYARRFFTGDLVNNGTVSVQQFTVFDKSGGLYRNHGVFNVSSALNIEQGGRLEQAGGTLNVDASLNFDDTGMLHLTGGVLELAGEVNLNGSVFTQSGGTLAHISGPTRCCGTIWRGTYNFLGGSVSGTTRLGYMTLAIGPEATEPASFQFVTSSRLAGDVHAGQTLRIDGFDTVLTSAAGFTNNGSILLQGSGITFGKPFLAALELTEGTLVNSASGMLHFQPPDRYSKGLSLSGDLMNEGTVLFEDATTFNKAGGSYTNNGKFTVNRTLTITGGTLTNFTGNTLTGGAYDVSGTLRFPGANIVTNQAEIVLRGTSSQIVNDLSGADGLANLATIGPVGALRLHSGRNFTAAGSFANEGVLELGGTTFAAPSLTNTGTILGHGTITGNVMNSTGKVAPDSSAAKLEIDGDYTQGTAGTLAIELASTTSHGRLSVTGNAEFEGMLVVSLIDGFSPLAGQSFDIFDWGTRSGTFETVTLPSLIAGLMWETSQLFDTGVLNVRLADDYNNDGSVDAADYVVWRKSDSTQNGYNNWRANFGRTSGGGSGSGGISHPDFLVPEPYSYPPALLAMMIAMLGRRAARSSNS